MTAHSPMPSTSPVAPFRAVYRLVLGQLVTRARLAAVGALSLLLVAIAIVVANNSDSVSAVNDGSRLIANLGLAIVVPVVALLFASTALGELREDKTLVYLWLTPVQRWVVPVAAVLASATVVVPAVVIPNVVAASIITTEGGLPRGALVATLLGAIAYNAVFVALGLLTKRTLVWGVAYILIWEGFVAGAGAGAARFALRAHTRSLLADATGTTLRLGDIPVATATTVLALVTVVSTTVAIRRYRSMTVD